MKRTVSSLLAITLIAASVASASADDKQSLTAADIITRHLQACGGKEALSKIKSRVAIGTVQKESSPAVPVNIMTEAPNRLSAVFLFQDSTNWRLIYDEGKVIFRPQFPRATSDIERKYREMLTTGTLFNSISLYNVLLQGDSSGVKFEAKGVKKVKGRAAYVLEGRRAKELSLKLYIDTETFMWVRIDYGRITLTHPLSTFTNDVTSKDEETTIDFYVETFDFKEVDGLKLPFKFEMVVTRPILEQKDAGTIIGKITEYRQNIPIDPRMFQ